MSWFVLAVTAAAIYGLQAVYLKAFTGEIDRLLVTWSIFLFTSPFLVGALVLTGVPTIEASFWWALGVSILVNLAAWPAFVYALQRSDVSLVMPLLAFTPLFVVAVEYLLLGVTPEGLGWAGIALIVFGAYVLNIQKGFSRVLDPLRALWSDQGARAMLGVAAAWSVSATVEKVAVTSASPTLYLAAFMGLASVLFLPIVSTRVPDLPKKVRRHWPVLGGAGALTAAMMLAQMYAVQTTPVVNYVIAIKRAGMLVAVLFGWLLFREGNIFFRAIGACLMVAGVALIRMA